MSALPAFFTDRIKVDSRGCWLWQGGLTYQGYGRVYVNNRDLRAHRFAYELLIGEVPEGLVLDHLCRVRNCVNPAHLEPVTDRVNALRGIGPAASLAAATHCQRGHELSGNNLLLEPRPNRSIGVQRRCRTCRRNAERNAYLKRKRNAA